MVQTLMPVLIFAPLLGFLINGFRFRSRHALLSGSIATGAVAISFIAALLLVFELVGLPGEQRAIVWKFADWIHLEQLAIDFSFVVDPISSIMILIITGIGTLIHLFSVGYMHEDEGVTKYFAYLNLFLFNMLLLVLGDNLLVMFVGWEGVGLCSYLLIGFWFKDVDKASAGMKAFITNRIGDAAFLLGMFILFTQFGTLQFSALNGMAPAAPELMWWSPITLATLMLFIGATGKSAQIPLYVWLPDAMAGPTPVSALIHAATMVTAGVYMIVRLNGLFIAAPNTLLVVAIIGALTAVMAASIGITQFDIKKVLAYSTVSQLGYMFLACGVGAFTAAIFHLMTHAFFKALMFLGSGSVIHGMHHEQDIRKMGGLAKKMPITHITFVLGWLAIIGVPPLAGFFSKDEILWMSFHSPLGHKGLWVLGVIGATMTAFYMTRLMALTFWGKSRVAKDVHPHESPWTMTVPLAVLAFLSVVGGWIGIPHVLGALLPGHPQNLLNNWLGASMRPIPNLAEADASLELGLMGISVALASISAFIAYSWYLAKPEIPQRLQARFSGFHKLVYNKYFVDEFYFQSFIDPLVQLSRSIWLYVDINFIDRTTYVVSDLVKGGGQLVRKFQNGNIQQYALYISLGAAAVVTLLLMR